MAWIALALVALIVLVWVSRLRFVHEFARGVDELAPRPAAPEPINRARIAELPSPVVRYLTKALDGRENVIRSAQFRHTGTFRPKLGGPWFPIRGREYVVTDPPGFIWWGRARIVPGIWVDAIDRLVRCLGNLRVALESMFVLLDGRGPAFDRGELLRFLSEMPLYPTAMLDRRYVEWEPIDERHAQATLRVGSAQVSGTFEFSEDGMPVAFSAKRERDIGGGNTEMTPWSGRFDDYRMVAGVRLPHRLEASWEIGGKRMPYARFEIETMKFDSVRPLGSIFDLGNDALNRRKAEGELAKE